MMSKRFLLIALIISFALNLATVATFGYLRWNVHRHRVRVRHGAPLWMNKSFDWDRGHLREKLNLSDEQIEELNAKHEEIRLRTQPLLEELFVKREGLIELLKDAKPDSVTADSLICDIVTLQTELELNIFRHMQKTKEILTTEQQELFMELIEKQMPPPGIGPGPPPRGKHNYKRLPNSGE